MSQTLPDASKRPTSLAVLVRSNLLGHLGGTLSLAAGVAVATAVITGALLVGDSMRGSLRQLTTSRMGSIDSLVTPGHFFTVGNKNEIDGVQAVTFMPGATAESSRQGDDDVRYGGSVNVMGIDPTFWSFDPMQADGDPSLQLDDDSVLLNLALAKELDVDVGDLVTIRLPTDSAVPADSPLGRREVGSEGLPRLRVAAIKDTGLFNFSIAPNQAAPRNAFLSRKIINDALDRRDAANALLIDSKGSDTDRDSPISIGIAPSDSIPLTLEDLGVKLEMAEQIFESETIFQYASLTSDQLLLSGNVVDALINKSGTNKSGTNKSRINDSGINDNHRSPAPVMTYLANAMTKILPDGSLGDSVPYSILTATDSTEDLPLKLDLPGSDEVAVVMNDWTARKLSAEIGDAVRIFYYEPEVQSGVEIERSFDAIVSDIVPITKPAKAYRRRRAAVFDQAPTRFNDPNLTPTVPGVTDQDSISDWDLPFPLERTISRDDDEYWQDYRLTPKAFVTLATGQKFFGSRFGNVTSIRYPNVTPETLPELEEKILQQLGSKLDSLGWSPIAIRDQQLKASSGTTPFDGLFLALSMFVIFAAILLIAMLCKLSLTVRTQQMATLSAVGWPSKRVARLFLSEGLVTSALGATVGAMLGIGYAWLMVQGLRTRWVGAVTTSFLELFVTPRSIIIGWLAGIVIAIAVIAWVVRQMNRQSPAQLMAGSSESVSLRSRKQSRSGKGWLGRLWLDGLLIFSISALMVIAIQSGGMTAAGLFVGAGMLLLIECLWVFFRRLGHGGTGRVTSLGSLALGTAARNPLRSTLAVGLMAIASFLVVSMTAFSLQPTRRGIGGFDWIATTASPIYRDLSDPSIRSGLLGTDADSFNDATFEPMRIKAGQDASCNNLYRAAAPTVLGIRPSIIGSTKQTDFGWAGHEAVEDGQSPWTVLFGDTVDDGQASSPIPVVIDQNTAMWSLGLTKGIGQNTSFEFDGETVHFRVVGLLAGSTLQGQLMISEKNFNSIFPNISGYRSFLIRSTVENADQILESRLNDVGMDVQDSRVVLAGMLAVQNTYLSTFQSLGALGLLLGTVGLAIAGLRSILSRRGELAVMRAVGFTRSRLAALVMGETASLLIVGIGIGTLCALIALAPTLWTRGDGSAGGPIATIVAVLLFGLGSGLAGVIKVVRMPLVSSLRSDH